MSSTVQCFFTNKRFSKCETDPWLHRCYLHIFNGVNMQISHNAKMVKLPDKWLVSSGNSDGGGSDCTASSCRLVLQSRRCLSRSTDVPPLRLVRQDLRPFVFSHLSVTVPPAGFLVLNATFIRVVDVVPFQMIFTQVSCVEIGELSILISSDRLLLRGLSEMEAELPVAGITLCSFDYQIPFWSGKGF